MKYISTFELVCIFDDAIKCAFALFLPFQLRFCWLYIIKKFKSIIAHPNARFNVYSNMFALFFHSNERKKEKNMVLCHQIHFIRCWFFYSHFNSFKILWIALVVYTKRLIKRLALQLSAFFLLLLLLLSVLSACVGENHFMKYYFIFIKMRKSNVTS